VDGIEFPAPCDGPPVPVLAFHGTEDPILPYAGGGLNATTISQQNLYKDGLPPGLPAPLGVDDSMALWAAHNGCADQPEEEHLSSEVRKRTWPDCDADTVLYIVDGGGHTWPGKPFPQFAAMFGPTTVDIDATDLLFQFFLDGEEEP
jgi:polyhydroxybutyrate depolymerase